MAYTTIDNPGKYFQVLTWTGNDATSRALTFGGEDSLQPDLVWTKIRTQNYSHTIFDSTRGVTKVFFPNETGKEETSPSQGFLTSFDSDGFTVEDGSSAILNFNGNNEKYVSFCWKETADAGMDITTYTGNGSSSRTVSHSLSAVPAWHLIKERSPNDEFTFVYHKSIGNTGGMYLTSTAAAYDNVGGYNDTDPTSSVVTLGDSGGINTNSSTYIMYLWTDKQGYSKSGKFEGNNNADGSFVYLGFKPAWVMIKDMDSQGTVGGSVATSWGIWDSKRMPNNPAGNPLWANKSSNETIRGNGSSANTGGSDGNGLGGFIFIDMLSNGFKCRTGTAELNGSNTYVYMAFAESPFVNSKGVPNNAR